MAVWVTIVGDAGTYRLSGQTADKSGYPYAGRLLNAPAIENIAKSTDQGNPVRNLSFAIDNVNDDDSLFISTATEILWNKDVTVSVDGCSETWTGKIRSFELQGNKTLVIDAIDDTYALFKKPIPDETIRIANFSQVGTEGTNTTISIPLGGTTSSPVRVKGTLVDRVNFIYLLAVGEIQSIVSIEKDRKTFPLGSPAAYTVALGTAGQPTYPGYAYVKFAADPRDSAGRWPDVHALVTGMKLGASTEAQCRNPARILYYLLTTAASGACGWGLGVSAGDLDATSFNAAITACDNLGFKIDGVIDQRRAASVWIEQICRAMRGRFVKRNGKHTLTVDADSASVKTYTTLNTILDSFGRGVYSDRKNRVVCDYRFDIADGRLLGSAVRDDAGSQASIGVNESRLELLLVSDHDAANKIADYLINVETYGEKRLQFRTLDVPAGGLKNDDVITVDLPGIGISSQTFRITNVTHKWFDDSTPEATVQCRSYDASIFSNTAPPVEPTWPTPASILPGPESMQAPSAVSAISLSSDVSVQDADGSTSAFVYGTFSLGARTLFVTVELGLGISPAPTTWRTVAATSTGSFRVDGLAVGAPYTFRFTAHNTGGDATPVTATITATRDTSAPGIASAISAGVFFKTTRIEITRNASVSNNLAGYAVYRHTSNDSAGASEVGIVTTSPNEQKAVFVDGNTTYATTYYYWVKSISRAGIRSGFSAGTGAVTTSPLNGGTDITSRTITADRICAASITAAEITTDYLTALKFRTKATTGDGSGSGDGICFDTTAIKGFAANSATPNFTLDATTGGITANLGSVGGWTIATYGLYKNTGTANTSAGMAPGDYPFYAGCEYAGRATAPFRVSNAGAVTATSGRIGGFSITPSAICTTQGLLGDTKTSMLDPGMLCFGCTSDTNICQCSCFSYEGLMACYSDGSAKPWVTIVPGNAYAVCICGCNTGSLWLSSALVGVCVFTGDWAFTSSGPYGGNGTGICIGGMGCFKTSVKADTCITAGTTITATCKITGGTTSLIDNAGWFTNNSAAHGAVLAQNNAGGYAVYGSGCIYATTGLHAGTCITAGTYVAAGTCVTAGTYVNATGDIYSGGWGRFTGWNANSGSLSNAALEIGFSSGNGSSYIQSYNRSSSIACPICLYGSLVRTNARVESVSTNGCLALNGTLPGYCAMQYPTLCSSGNYLYLQAGSSCCKSAYLDCNGSFLVPSAIGAGNSNLNARFHLKASSGGWDGAIKMERAGANTQTWSIAVGDDNVLYFGYASCPTTCPTYYACLTTVGVWTNYSQRAGKTDFTQVSVLPTLRGLPLSAYRLRDTDIWGFGPTAEDWQCAYPFLGDGRGVAASHMAGVALAGVKELDSCLASQQACILSLESRLAAIEEKLSAA